MGIAFTRLGAVEGIRRDPASSCLLLISLPLVSFLWRLYPRLYAGFPTSLSGSARIMTIDLPRSWAESLPTPLGCLSDFGPGDWSGRCPALAQPLPRASTRWSILALASLGGLCHSGTCSFSKPPRPPRLARIRWPSDMPILIGFGLVPMIWMAFIVSLMTLLPPL